MTALLWVLGGLTVALVAVHMTRPYASQALLSAARFFWPVTAPGASRRRWRLANPLRSRPLWLQFPAAVMLLLALFLHNQTAAAVPQTQALGIWVLLDTSESMSAHSGEGTRFDSALLALKQVADAAARAAQGESLCFRFSTFDQELRHLLTDADAPSVLGLAPTLQPRALGTNLGLVSNLVEQPPDQVGGRPPGCRITHFAVISDQPNPQAAVAFLPGDTSAPPPSAQAVATATVPVVWESVELKTANSAITAVDAEYDPLSQRVTGVTLRLSAFGEIPPTQFEITSPNASLSTVAPAWQTAGPQVQQWVYQLEDPAPGTYTFRLTADDGIAFDNLGAIEIPAREGLRVDWRLGSTELPDQVGWRIDAANPMLRVAAAGSLSQLPSDDVPLLLVGNGYGAPFAPAQIVDFADNNILLDNVSFEQLEQTGMAPLAVLAQLPEAFAPVLAGSGGADAPVWLAERQTPPAVYIPGLPGKPDLGNEVWRTNALLFANATRSLLKEQGAPVLYTVTTPNEPNPDGVRIALHPAESNTMLTNKAAADLSILSPQPAVEEGTPVWPWLVAAALAVLVAERSLAAWRGGPWC